MIPIIRSRVITRIIFVRVSLSALLLREDVTRSLAANVRPRPQNFTYPGLYEYDCSVAW